MEILNINGLIAGGLAASSLDARGGSRRFWRALGEWLPGTLRAELTIARFSGPPLARKPNKAGVPVLQKK
jgi:hypothetical protein